MTVMNGDDPALPEELDEQTEMEMLRQEVSDSMRKVQEYRAGNTALIEALMCMCDGPDAAMGDALSVLGNAGMRNPDGTLNWDALQERKDNRWTWEHCVRALVKQPAEVERLLVFAQWSKP